jgi:hypothetical protein
MEGKLLADALISILFKSCNRGYSQLARGPSRHDVVATNGGQDEDKIKGGVIYERRGEGMTGLT